MTKYLIIIIFLFALNENAQAQKDSLAKDTASYFNKTLDVAKKYLPEIKKILKEQVGPVAKETLSNDILMRLIFDKTYDFLPFPVKFVLNKETFTQFGIKNRYLLIEQLPDKPTQNKEVKK